MPVKKNRVIRRSQGIGAIFLLLFFGIIFRFYHLQIVDASVYQEKAQEIYNREKNIHAHRGTIFDRNEETIAKEASAYTVVAIIDKSVTNRVKDPLMTAQELAPILEMSVERLHKLMTQEDRFQVELRPGGWKLGQEKMEQIRDLKLPGIFFIEEPKRYYPNQDFATHVIGFLNHDGKPVMGLEASLNEWLQGKDGYLQFKKDAKGNRLPQGLSEYTPAKNGENVYLTIDERIQLYVEQALDEANQKYHPEKMTVIVAKPQTGEILAMSSRPSFNPNEYAKEPIENYVNHAVTSTFEPGSTFKIITLAAAIEEGIYDGDATYQSGSITVSGKVVRDHKRGGWGKITFLEGVQKSSNVAFTLLGWKEMPKNVFYSYIEKFGFGQLTGIELPNEKKGFVKSPHNLPEIDRATMTFGQGVAVTAIQQVAAVNAIANGGKLLKPYIIAQVKNAETGEVVLQNKPEVVQEQVVSKRTAQEVRDILETVVTDGTGKNFYLEGYQVAGKTGTAQKVGENGRYIEGEYIHSFIGFAPKDDPKVVVYVLVDTPEVNYLLGGSVVAEIFKTIMQDSLQYLSVEPKIEEVSIQSVKSDSIKVPDFNKMSLLKARQKADESGLEVIVFGDGSKVTEQSPNANGTIYANERVFLIAGKVTESVLPDFSGWTLRELKDWASMANVELKMSGSGYVMQQSLPPGQKIQAGQQIQVELQSKYAQQQELAGTSDLVSEDELITETTTEVAEDTD